jgi:hypothetical protein
MLQISLFGVPINIIGHIFFVFVQKKICVVLWRFDFFYQTFDLHKKIEIGPYFMSLWLDFYVLRQFLNVIKCSFILYYFFVFCDFLNFLGLLKF